MNEEKRDRIKRAVDQLEGRFPPHKGEPNEVLWSEPRNNCIGIYQSYSHGFKAKNWFREVCTRDEFEQVARELGYVNGYLWGKEYPANGDKPDLPDDVKVSVVASCTGSLWRCSAGSLLWSDISVFTVIDSRYKPK